MPKCTFLISMFGYAAILFGVKAFLFELVIRLVSLMKIDLAEKIVENGHLVVKQ